MNFLSHIPAFLKNKYFLTITGLLVWMFFFDRNDFPSQWERHQKLKELQNSAGFYSQKIEAARAELEKRKTDPAAYERIAREKYYMKKDNEDIFLFNQ
ncbi:MAG: septum formation initiator family protein [Chitinophagaceae bacterium]|nr:septum formation initiator family protein [Chitinophagaceae bacterium]